MNAIEVLGIGNAIVDVIALVDDEFLRDRQFLKSSMTLVSEEEAEGLFSAMQSVSMVSGGSAANTIFGAAHLGCSTAFMGRVRNDALGDRFRDDIRQAGVLFPVPACEEGPQTGRCFVFVTPDGERTMRTFLGACQMLSEEDIDADVVAACRYVYLEGYLWDPPPAKAAFLKASAIAHANGRDVALSLSDPFCVDRYRSEFIALMREGQIDRLFANEAELISLYQAESFESAVRLLRAEGINAVVTRSEKGCVVVERDHAFAVEAQPGIRVVDTTGAGDLFAAGFLTGLARGLTSAECARLGAIAAAEIVQHVGARPISDVRAIAASHNLFV